MDELISLLGGSLPLLLFLLSIVLYFQNRPEKPKEDPAVKEPLRWNEMEDLRWMYASMPLDRLVHLYCEFGLKDEARQLLVQELKNRGWQERTLDTGDTLLVESTSQEVQVSSNWVN